MMGFKHWGELDDERRALVTSTDVPFTPIARSTEDIIGHAKAAQAKQASTAPTQPLGEKARAM